MYHEIVSTIQQEQEELSINRCELGVLYGLCRETVGLIGDGGGQSEDVARTHGLVCEFSIPAKERESHSPFAHDEDATRLLSLVEENGPATKYDCVRHLFEGGHKVQLRLWYFCWKMIAKL